MGKVTNPSTVPGDPLKFVLSTGDIANGSGIELPPVPVPATSNSVTAGTKPDRLTTLVPVGWPTSVNVMNASEPPAVLLSGRRSRVRRGDDDLARRIGVHREVRPTRRRVQGPFAHVQVPVRQRQLRRIVVDADRGIGQAAAVGRIAARQIHRHHHRVADRYQLQGLWNAQITADVDGHCRVDAGRVADRVHRLVRKRVDAHETRCRRIRKRAVQLVQPHGSVGRVPREDRRRRQAHRAGVAVGHVRRLGRVRELRSR